MGARIVLGVGVIVEVCAASCVNQISIEVKQFGQIFLIGELVQIGSLGIETTNYWFAEQ